MAEEEREEPEATTVADDAPEEVKESSPPSPPAAPSDGVKMSGTVNWFNVAKGFGFITREDGQGDIFVHQSDIYSEGFRSLRDEEPVEFTLQEIGDGRYKAVHVTGPNGAFVQGALPRNSYRQRMPYGANARGGVPSPGGLMMPPGVPPGWNGAYGPGMGFPPGVSPPFGAPGYGYGAPGAYPPPWGAPPWDGGGGGAGGPPGARGGTPWTDATGAGGAPSLSPAAGPLGDFGPGNNKRVVVLNLPFSTTWEELKATFASVGSIARAHVAVDETGRSRGYGTVRFQTEEDATSAIEKMNGAEYEGRVLTVRMDKYQN